MYKALTAADFKKMFGLPDDYAVEGMLSYGAWDRPKHEANLRKALGELGVSFVARTTAGFLGHILELEIGGKRYWFTVMYGGALLSELLHLACLFGSKRNIHIGSCGGLNPAVGNKELIAPTWSYGDESTTRAYEPEAKDFKHHPDPALAAALIAGLPQGYKVWEGPIITNQAMMGETWDDVRSWSERGYYGVEMETATVFAVSRHFGVPAAALLYVSDNLVKGQAIGSESHMREKAEREKVKADVYKASLQALINKQ